MSPGFSDDESCSLRNPKSNRLIDDDDLNDDPDLDPNYEPDESSLSSDDDNPEDRIIENSELQESGEIPKKGCRKRKAQPNEWKRTKNKRLREAGQAYIGFRKKGLTHNGKNAYVQDVPKEAKKIGRPCKCILSKISNRFHCQEFSNEDRNHLFNTFWNAMTWGERRVYVVGLVDVREPKRRRQNLTDENSRKGKSNEYNLPKEGKRLQVCKTQFLSTLGIRPFTVRSWLSSVLPKEQQPMNVQSIPEPLAGHAKTYLRNFLTLLPKMESHYCRATSSRLYLEPDWESQQHLFREYKLKAAEDGADVLSWRMFNLEFNNMNLSLYRPKKDLCDTCVAFKAGNVSDTKFKTHMQRKEEARHEKQQDKEAATKNSKMRVFCVDMQAVLLCPKLNASALYYKTKLKVHNYTLYNLVDHSVECYLWHEGNGGLSSDVFASCLSDFLKNACENGDTDLLIVWSDGCTYQNRNVVLSNALLRLSIKYNVVIDQKYLERGHTQMEMDSVHSVIEKKLRHHDINVPADYASIISNARAKPSNYDVHYLDYTFFKDHKANPIYPSIRPGKKAGEPTVTDIRCLRYKPSGAIRYKLEFSHDWQDLPQRANRDFLKMNDDKQLYDEPQKIQATKYLHLQELKRVIRRDYHAFYDALPHF